MLYSPKMIWEGEDDNARGFWTLVFFSPIRKVSFGWVYDTFFHVIAIGIFTSFHKPLIEIRNRIFNKKNVRKKGIRSCFAQIVLVSESLKTALLNDFLFQKGL